MAMIRIGALALALIALLPPSARAQSQSQGLAVTSVDVRGNPVGTSSNPILGAGASTTGPGGIAAFSRITSSAASANLTNAKASAGRAYTYQGCNTTASTIYLRIYNAASIGAVTVGTTPPFAGPYAFPANTCIQTSLFAGSIGIYASSGLTYAFGTSPADTDTTAVTAGGLAAFQIGFQ